MQLHRRTKAIEQAGAKLVFIGQATPRHAAHFRRRLELTEPVLADEKRESYRLAGAKMATLTELVGPTSVAKGMLRAANTGQVQGRTIGHPAQLGGVLIVAPGDEVIFSHMAHSADDNAGADEILAALRG